MNYFRKGRKCGVPGAGRKKSVARLEREEKQRQDKAKEESKAFNKFETATSGNFNGFQFAEIFHEKISKNDAIYHTISDDKGDAMGVHVGADGVNVYFFCEPENAKKYVTFNRSVYIF